MSWGGGGGEEGRGQGARGWGGGLGSNYARVCVSKSEGNGKFWLQRSEMSENISLKMGVRFAASLNMGNI